MLLKFKSRAAGDVIMFGDAAQALLAHLGKDPNEAQGMFTVAQLGEAIARLKALIADDKARKDAPAETSDDDTPSGMTSPVALWQRAVPLLELMSYALKEDHPVLWEKQGR